jgi:hypothetical protein
MARHEADREDLFAEASGLVRKLEGHVADSGPAVLAGFRPDGVLVVYFGSDPMVQFDRSGRLRRAFVDGQLYRAHGTTLARLTRSRTADETALVRHDLSADELRDFRARLRGWIEPLAAALDAGRFMVIRRWPVDDEGLVSAIGERLRAACAAADWIAEPLR